MLIVQVVFVSLCVVVGAVALETISAEREDLFGFRVEEGGLVDGEVVEEEDCGAEVALDVGAGVVEDGRGEGSLVAGDELVPVDVLAMGL